MSKFVKGDPRINRKGRTTSHITKLREDLKRLASEPTQYKTREGKTITIPKHMAILLNIIEGAVGGDAHNQKLYLEYLCGKPTQHVQITEKIEDIDDEILLGAMEKRLAAVKAIQTAKGDTSDAMH